MWLLRRFLWYFLCDYYWYTEIVLISCMCVLSLYIFWWTVQNISCLVLYNKSDSMTTHKKDVSLASAIIVIGTIEENPVFAGFGDRVRGARVFIV